MFKYHPSAPLSMQLCALDPDDPVARNIMRKARYAAMLKHDRKDNGCVRDQLRAVMEPLDMGQLNMLAVMLMIVHPNVHAAATGTGGIWAMASVIVNEVARELLKDRPAFELVV